MVKPSQPQLDTTFAALSDPTRRVRMARRVGVIRRSQS